MATCHMPYGMWLLLGRILGHRFNLPSAFFDVDHLARRHVGQSVDHATRPPRFDRPRFRRLAQAEMDAKVVLRIVAAAAANLVDLYSFRVKPARYRSRYRNDIRPAR